MLLGFALSLAACGTRDRNDRVSDHPEHLTPGEGGRAYVFTYSTVIPVPEGSRVTQAWVPLPLQDPGVQGVYHESYTVEGGTAQVTKEPVYGNRMIHVTGPGKDGAIKVSWQATVVRNRDLGQGALPSSGRYLASDQLVPIELASTYAAQIGTTNSTVPTEDRAQLIYDDVLNGMTYDKSGEGWGRGDFAHSVTICKGNCTDFHSRFTGISRASGIPARFTMGIPLKPTPEGTYNSYHCWAHWLDQGYWKPVDISEADKVVDKNPALAASMFGALDSSRLALTVGRDIDLQPKQAGPALNYFVFPYAEADGTPIQLSKKDWVFTWKDL